MVTRLTKEARRDQLLDVATQIIREKGTEALTLITLAQEAGVTKPITYNHFATRQSLLLAIYKRCDKIFVETMNAKIEHQANCFDEAVQLFSDAYLECVEQNGREYEEVVFALMAYPDHRHVRRVIRDFFCDVLIDVFRPFVTQPQQLLPLRMAAIFGAIEGISTMFNEARVKREEARKAIENVLCCQLRD
ncbi:TetR/AcrR family transcriptional regulator [Oceanimonas baumannii]|uniref:TetR/AcrR family transcriptional regulator n=1 Tax=Oceanimonas baumannii TaxID=129578 RepID=UPI003A90FEFB